MIGKIINKLIKLNNFNIIKVLYMSLNINEIIKELYYTKPISFFKSYGAQLAISILIIFIFIMAISYFQFKNTIPEIKKNWNKNRCNPVYMPYAGLVYKRKGESNFSAIQRNFDGCINNILQSIADDALTPIHYVINIIGDAIKAVEDAFDAIRATFDKARTSVANIAENMSGRTLNIMIPVQKMFIYMKDFLSKVRGVYATGVYTLIGSYLLTKSTIFNAINLIITTIILVLVASIAAALLLFPIGAAIAAPMIAIFLAIAIILIPVITNFDHQMGGNVSLPLPHW
tara:strand:+ start:1415 stop:2275 length:861 start_codon:yes stop_codon:yes gene_type:complete